MENRSITLAPKWFKNVERIAVAAMGLVLMSMVGCDSDVRVAQIMDPIESGDTRIGGAASSIAAFRTTLDESARVAELLRLGEQASEYATRRLAAAASGTAMSDESVAIYAYIVEKHNYDAARDHLRAYLMSGPAIQHHFLGPQFVIRTLLVLAGQPDPTAGYKFYSDVDVVRAITGQP